MKPAGSSARVVFGDPVQARHATGGDVGMLVDANRQFGRLWAAAAVLTAAAPVVLALSHRSIPLVLSIAAVLALLAEWGEGSLPRLWASARRVLSGPLGLAALAFLAWAAVSIAWAPAQAKSLRDYGEFAGSLIAPFVLALALPRRMPRRALALFLGGVVVASVIIVADLWSGLAFRRALGLRPDSFVYNRPALTLLVLAAPLLSLWRAVPIPAALAGVLLALTISRSESGAAVLGLFVGGLSFAAARLLPRRTAIGLAAAGLGAALALAPIAGELLEHAMPASVHDRLRGTSSRARVEIARAFGALVREDPWIGTGFGASAGAERTSAAARIAPEFRTLLGVGHPHDAALQVWVELGVLGATLAFALAFLLLRGMSGLPVERFAPRLALLMSAAAVSLVGQGAWQGWWPAAIGAAIVWLRFADGPGEEEAP